MSAIFNFQSLLTVILLLICTCTYIRSLAPNLFDKRLGKVGVLFGNVLGLGKERALMWPFVVSSWPLVFYFGHNIPVQAILVKSLGSLCIYRCILMYIRMRIEGKNKRQV